MAEACASRTHRRHQRCLPPVLKTGRVTGPHALPFFQGSATLHCVSLLRSRGCIALARRSSAAHPKQFSVVGSRFSVKAPCPTLLSRSPTKTEPRNTKLETRNYFFAAPASSLREKYQSFTS